MINEQRILKTTSIIPVLSIIIFSIISISGFYYTTSQNNKAELTRIKQDYLNNQKLILKNEINTAYKYIQNKINTLSSKLTKEELQKIILNDISNIRSGENGYFFIYDYDNIMLMHPIKSELVGTDLTDLADINGVKIIQELVKVSKNDGGYVRFVWNKPSTDKLTNKLAYAIGLDNWRWGIATGVYLDDVNDVIKQKENQLNAQSLEILENFAITSFIIMIIMSFILVKLMGKIQIIFLEYNKKLLNYQKDLEADVLKKTNQINSKNRELKYKVYHDNLTDILNRVSLQEFMRDNQSEIILSIFDIKEFSKINNIYGEYAGDEILKTFARMLIKLFEDDKYIVYRISGDKFALLNQEPISERTCKNFIQERLYTFIEQPLKVVVDEQVLDVVLRCVVGIAKGVASEKLIEHTDMALNYAKKNHEQIVIYSQKLQIEDLYKEDMRITQEVKNAINDDRVVPFFQSIVKDNETTFECLVRIKNEDGTIMSPNRFLPIIMQTEYYSQITRIMVDKSFTYFHNTGYSFSINLSFKDISNKLTRMYIKSKIKQYKVESQLILEILESESIENFDLVRDFIEDMKSMGVRIAIDDFGSGYSNFTYLIELKPDFVKIDGSLIKDIHCDENAYIMVKNISRFLKEMNLQTIAEYVHNKEVYDIVKTLGFDGIQGYYLSPPLPDVIEDKKE